MPIDLIALGAALLSGLLGGVHCVAMCGGVATGLAMSAGPRPSLAHAVRVNLGRVGGYVVAGALAGGVGDGVLRVVRVEAFALGARVLLGVVLLLVGLRLLDRAGRLAFLQRPAALLWRRLAPLQRRLLPARTPVRQLALGLLWGWMPCGLSTMLLFAAWLEADALHGALLMGAFGAGTLPVMLPLTWSGARLGRWLARPAQRGAAAALLIASGAVTAAAPWLMQAPALHAALAALGCRSV